MDIIEINNNRSLVDIPDEKWIQVSGYEELYSISSLGRLRAHEKVNGKGQTLSPKILKPTDNGHGYRIFNFRKDNIPKIILIHRVVALHFVDNPDNKPYVNHKNGIKWDNRAINFEWVTKSENALHLFNTLGYRVWHKGKSGIIRSNSRPVEQYDINGSLISQFPSIRIAATTTNIHFSNIHACIDGRRKIAGGFTWKLKNA